LTYLRAVIAAAGAVAALAPFPAFSQMPQSTAPGISAVVPGGFPMRLESLSQSLHATRTARILVIGSSSTVGIGASSPSRTYVARLETDLESSLKGTDFEVIAHGMSGEVAQGAADRMKREVEEAKPDLVIWQVGTNDALRHVEIDKFRSCLKKTLAWLKGQGIDVILINPQFGEVLVKDAYYEEVVAAIADVARETHVLLVDRFDAMRKLQREHQHHIYLSPDNLHMNDEGYRCLAEQIAAVIVKALPKVSSTVAQAHR
jgi:acyl-CoA thioesterase-1